MKRGNIHGQSKRCQNISDRLCYDKVEIQKSATLDCTTHPGANVDNDHK